MPLSQRPNEDYPRWANAAGADISEPNGARKDLGFEADDVASQDEHNWLVNKVYEWTQYLDEARLGWEAYGRQAEWKSIALTYTQVAGFTQSLLPGYCYVDGTRIELDAQRIADLGEDSVAFAPSSTTTVSLGRLSSIGGDDHRWVTDHRTAGAAPAGFTDILEVVTDGAGVTAVNSLVENAPRSAAGVDGWITEAPLRHRGDLIELQPQTAQDFEFSWRNPAGSRRFRLLWDESADVLSLRPTAGAILGAVNLAIDNATGRMVFGVDGSGAGDINAGYDFFGVGELASDGGFSCLFDTEFRIVFTHASATVNGYIAYTSADVLELNAGGSAVEIIDSTTTFRPTTDNAISNGDSTRRWREAHFITGQCTRLQGVGAATLTIGESAAGGDILLEAPGDDANPTRVVRMRTHEGMSAGDFDLDYKFEATRVGQTNTNGNEDIIIVDNSAVSVEAAFLVEVVALGVEDTDSDATYLVHQKIVWEYDAGTLSLRIGAAALGEDEGSGGTWPGTATATQVVDGSGNIALRVTAADTRTRNWMILVRVLRITHNDVS